MFYLVKKIEISAAHRLSLNYESKCSNTHGHNWDITVHLKSQTLDENGMIMDFVVLKKKLKEMIDEMDHAVLLPARSEIVKITAEEDSVLVDNCGKKYMFPRMDVRMLDVPTTTAEEMSKMMTRRMVSEIEFPSNVRSVSIGLDEERGQTAWYTEVL